MLGLLGESDTIKQPAMPRFCPSSSSLQLQLQPEMVYEEAQMLAGHGYDQMQVESLYSCTDTNIDVKGNIIMLVASL